MKAKIVIIISLLVFSSLNKVQAENDDFTESVTKLLSWFSDIDKVLTNISDKEKMKRIYRQIGYVSEDIDNIALEKGQFVNTISRLDSPVSDKSILELRKLSTDITSDLNLLSGRLSYIKADLSQTDQSQIDEVIQLIRKNLSDQKAQIMINIDSMINSGNWNITELKNEAEKATKLSENISKEVLMVKSKIKAKLDSM